MTLTKAEFKADGLDELKLYLLAQTQPVRQAELARRFGVNRSTIWRWLTSLKAIGVPILWDEQKRVSIDRTRYFTHLTLSSHESVVVMLALRLLQQYQDEPNQHATAVLHKLGVALQRGIAPEVGAYVLALADQQRDMTPERRPDKQKRLEAVGDAWIDSRKLEIRYRPFRSRQSFEELFHPYIIEPSAIGHSTYAIGFSELAGALRTRKIERMERAMVQDERFEVYQGFEPHKLLAGAWGIWFDQDDIPTTVKLRFSPTVARRVTETRWHPSERTEPDGEGGLLWSAEVDEEQEMVWWIRSWGPSCEVLEPAKLREQMQGEVRQLMRQYGITESLTDNRQQRFDDIFG